ncbi:MAG: hypothetical protein R2860_10725 [Desulfobacterales bacterium]
MDSGCISQLLPGNPSGGLAEYVIPYVEYSNIVKETDGCNNSELVDIGAAWAVAGGIFTPIWLFPTAMILSVMPWVWRLRRRLVWSSNRVGENPTDKWEYRLNINFGYYF